MIVPSFVQKLSGKDEKFREIDLNETGEYVQKIIKWLGIKDETKGGKSLDATLLEMVHGISFKIQ